MIGKLIVLADIGKKKMQTALLGEDCRRRAPSHDAGPSLRAAEPQATHYTLSQPKASLIAAIVAPRPFCSRLLLFTMRI
jgi:hypothetical protein